MTKLNVHIFLSNPKHSRIKNWCCNSTNELFFTFNLATNPNTQLACWLCDVTVWFTTKDFVEMATNTLCPKHFPKEAEMSGNADTISQLMGLYFLVVVVILTAWALGCFQMAFYWTFLLCGFIFVVWRTKLRQILRNKIFAVECLIHRKRALRQNESSEWLNFILNRW